MAEILQGGEVIWGGELEAFFLVLDADSFIVDILLEVEFFVFVTPRRKLFVDFKLLCPELLKITLTKHYFILFSFLLGFRGRQKRPRMRDCRFV